MRNFVFAFVACIGLTAGLARSDEPGNQRPPQSVGGIDSKTGGTISGVIRFNGTKPVAKPIEEIGGNAFCKEHHDGPLPLHDSFVFGKNGSDDTLQNVLVYVSKGLEGKTFDAPREPVILDQVGCMYTPHVVAVMVGQTLEIRNSDATLHNVMTMPRENPPFNIGMAVQGGKLEKTFARPEFKMNLRCFMHPWMSAYVHVMANPFFAISGADGTYTIRGLPAGEYEITVLHETSMFEAEPAVMMVKIGAGETKTADFVFRPKGEKK